MSECTHASQTYCIYAHFLASAPNMRLWQIMGDTGSESESGITTYQKSLKYITRSKETNVTTFLVGSTGRERFDARVRPRLEKSQPRLDVRKKSKFTMLVRYRFQLEKCDKSLPEYRPKLKSPCCTMQIHSITTQHSSFMLACKMQRTIIYIFMCVCVCVRARVRA
jgi:hypothetical protein